MIKDSQLPAGARRAAGAATLIVLLAPAGHAADYVRITTDNARIRTTTSLDAEIVAQAHTGDVFKLKARVGDWFVIFMFSGEARYVHQSIAETTALAPDLPDEDERRRAACIDIVLAQDQAGSDAAVEYPHDFDYREDARRLLYDRYELPIFHKHGLSPARNSELVVECAERRWLPQ
jgi:hypothetical protein